MSALNRLNNSLYRDILENWVCVSDVCKLDIANTNSSTRNHFLSILADSTRSDDDVFISDTLIAWLELRKLNLKRILVDNNSFSKSELIAKIQFNTLYFTRCWKSSINGLNEILSTSKVSDLALTDSSFICDKLCFSSLTLLSNCNFSKLSKIEDDFIIDMSTHCNQIKHIDLSRCGNLTERGFMALFRNNKGLETIDLSLCTISDSTLETIAENCPNLTSLNITGCSEARDGVDAVVKSCPRIISLVLRDCGIEVMTDGDILTDIANHLPNIQTIDISGNEVDSDGLKLLCTTCKRITHLAVEHQHLTSKVCALISENLKSLRKVEFFPDYESEFLAIAELFNEITVLDFELGLVEGTRSAGGSNVTAQNATTDGKIAVKADESDEEEREDEEEDDDEDSVTSERDETDKNTAGILTKVSPKCGKLTTLMVRWDMEAGDIASFIAVHGAHITTLNMSKINAASLALHSAAIAAHCSDLVSFDALSCDLTDAQLVPILERNPNLTSLIAARCDVTDATLFSIAGNCKKLKRLELSSCDKISDTGLLAVAEGCRRLQVLAIGSCTDITKVAIDRVVEVCKHLNDMSFNCTTAFADFDQEFRSKYAQ